MTTAAIGPWSARKEKYAEWIEAYVAAQPNRFVRGKCHEATTRMIAAFPELRKAAGFVYCVWGRDEHIWCVAPDGSIVDPTRGQFPGGIGYEELDLNNPADVAKIPTGKCPDCGGETYAGNDFCDDDCAQRYTAYLNAEIRR